MCTPRSMCTRWCARPRTSTGWCGRSRKSRAWCSTPSSTASWVPPWKPLCAELKVPCVPVLDPILKMFDTYLGSSHTPTIGGQHVLNAEYFRRIEALNFAMLHDDGHLPDPLDERRHRADGHQPHVKDADQHLSRQPRLQDHQRADRAGHPHSGGPGAADHGVCRRAGGDRRPHLPGAPAPGAQQPRGRHGRVYRPRQHRPGAGVLPADLRARAAGR